MSEGRKYKVIWDSGVFVFQNQTARTTVQPSLNPSLGVPYFRTKNPPPKHHPLFVPAKAQNSQFEA